MSINLDTVVPVGHDSAVVATWVVHPTRAVQPYVPPEIVRRLTPEQAAIAARALTVAYRFTLYADGRRSMEAVPYETGIERPLTP